MSKGSHRRPTNEAAFQANYDAIFGKKVIDMEAFEPAPVVICQNKETCSEPFCNCEVKHDAE